MVRIKEDIWEDYEKLCAEEGTNRAADMRRHVYSRIAKPEIVRKFSR